MPLFSQSIDHSTLNGPPTSTADWDAHLVMAWQAVEFSLQFPGISSQLLPINKRKVIKTPGTKCVTLQSIDSFIAKPDIVRQTRKGEKISSHSPQLQTWLQHTLGEKYFIMVLYFTMV